MLRSAAHDPAPGWRSGHLHVVGDGTAEDARIGVTEVYRNEYRAIARLAFLLVGDRHRAEDIAHDSFAKLYERWAEIDDRSKAVAYLRVTVSNLAISGFRRKGVATRHPAPPALTLGLSVVESAESMALATDARDRVLDALQHLAPKQRAAVVLRHWLQLTESEIAAVLGCSIGSARTHIARGHKTLATRLETLR